MESIDRLLEIAKDNFKEGLSFLPLDLNGNEIHPPIEILKDPKNIIYDKDTDSISLAYGCGYIYVRGKWADRVWSYFNKDIFERLPVRQIDMFSSLFMASLMFKINNEKNNN